MEHGSFFTGDGESTHEDSVDTASGGHKNYPLEGLAINLAEIVDSAELFNALVENPITLRALIGSLE